MFRVSSQYKIRPEWILGNYSILLHACSQSARAVPGPQKAVQLVTQRAQEALNDERETALRALVHQQGEILAVTHQCEVAARQHLVHVLTRNHEALTC